MGELALSVAQETGRTMKFGLGLPTCHEGLINPVPFFAPTDFVPVAQLAERLGYDSIWGTDHYSNQEYVRRTYSQPPNFYEVLTVLSALATTTQHIQLGTAVLAMPLRDIVAVAKQVMTLDQLSSGRVLLGVGIGAYREEFAAVRPELIGKNRGAMLEEGLELFGRLATEHIVTHQGRFYQTQKLEMYPKPYRKPLPILVAGHAENAIDRAVRLGHGWIPSWQPFGKLRESITTLRRKAIEAGRDPASLIVAPQHACLLAETQEDAERRFSASGMVAHRRSLAASGRRLTDAIEHMLVGNVETVREKVEQLHTAGADHVASITFTVNTVDEYLEQVHIFAEEIMVPYRRDHGLSMGGHTEATASRLVNQNNT
jgi:probable F420-dependent oxidoreductase